MNTADDELDMAINKIFLMSSNKDAKEAILKLIHQKEREAELRGRIEELENVLEQGLDYLNENGFKNRLNQLNQEKE